MRSLELAELTLPYGLHSDLNPQPESFSFLILPNKVAKGTKQGIMKTPYTQKLTDNCVFLL